MPGPRTPPTVTFGDRGNEFYFKFKLRENILTRVQQECSIFLFLPAPFVIEFQVRIKLEIQLKVFLVLTHTEANQDM